MKEATNAQEEFAQYDSFIAVAEVCLSDGRFVAVRKAKYKDIAFIRTITDTIAIEVAMIRLLAVIDERPFTNEEIQDLLWVDFRNIMELISTKSI